MRIVEAVSRFRLRCCRLLLACTMLAHIVSTLLRPVIPRRSIGIWIGRFAHRTVFSDAPKGIPEHIIAATYLVDGKVSSEHAAVGAEASNGRLLPVPSRMMSRETAISRRGSQILPTMLGHCARSQARLQPAEHHHCSDGVFVTQEKGPRFPELAYDHMPLMHNINWDVMLANALPLKCRVGYWSSTRRMSDDATSWPLAPRTLRSDSDPLVNRHAQPVADLTCASLQPARLSIRVECNRSAI